MAIPSPGLAEQPACFQRGQEGEEGRGGGTRLWKRQGDQKIFFGNSRCVKLSLGPWANKNQC